MRAAPLHLAGLVPALLLFAALPLAGCRNGQPRPAPAPDAPLAPPTATDPGWRSAVLLDTGSKLSGVAVGDLLPDTPGNEIVAVGTDHSMHLIWYAGGEWHHEVIARTPGEMIQVAAGDVDPERPGDEIVAVGVATGAEDDPGVAGAAIYVRREGDAWTASQVFEDTALLHGVCIAKGEVWVTGYSDRIHLLGRDPDGPWSAFSAPLPGPGRSIAATPDGVTVACRDGSLVDVSLSGVVGPVPHVRNEREAGRARVAAAGGARLTADDDGTLTLFSAGERTVLHENADKLRGAVLADLDPSAPGLEAATAGYDGRIRVFTRARDAWREDVVATDTDRFHHLTAGELPGWDGVVLIGVNYSGRVTVAGKLR